MKYLVKIDPSSIVKNKNAGDTETHIFIGTDEVIQPNGSVQSVAIYRTAHHPPVPEFNFSYHLTEIECSKCKEKSEIADLGYDSNYSDEGEKLKSSETVCPHCNHWDCCVLEFQLIEDLEPMKEAQ